MAFDHDRYERRLERKKCLEKPGERMCRALERLSRDKFLFPDEVMQLAHKFASLAGSKNTHATVRYWLNDWCFVFGMIQGNCPVTPLNESDRGVLANIVRHHMKTKKRDRDSVTFEILDFLTNQGRYKWKRTN